jgi:hypothetical protein
MQRFRVRALWTMLLSVVLFGVAGGMAWAGSGGDHAALVGAEVRVVHGAAPAFDNFFAMDVPCQAGERAIGGGFFAPTALSVQGSVPTKDGDMADEEKTANGWRVIVSNTSFKQANFSAYAICAGP